jgi:hypothetical protein
MAIRPGPCTMPHNRPNLNPFAHDCYEPPRAGKSVCPACHWIREQIAAEVVRSFDLKPEYQECELYQIGLEALGLVPA